MQPRKACNSTHWKHMSKDFFIRTGMFINIKFVILTIHRTKIQRLAATNFSPVPRT